MATATAVTSMIDPSYIALGVVITIAVFMIGWFFGTRRGHQHMWDHLMSNDEWDWFYCRDCLMMCCHKLDLSTGLIIERNYFDKPKDKKGKSPKGTTIAKG